MNKNPKMEIMSTPQDNPRQVISTAWGGMLALLIVMLLLDPLRKAMGGDYAGLSLLLQQDPGEQGLRILIGMICLNALVQVLVHVRSCRTARVTALVLSALYGLFFVAHHIIHLRAGEQPGLQTGLDMTHHLLAGLAVWGAWRWMKQA
ncbi:hypothetical protein [Sphaerotilus uruguayifluvii]|uniref:DUF4383 domain-containing protein n=1 Tax=Sphaerotilus uruguayifluvii TaxID=2735897 RepID=A0ABX2G154_9BURK|nr:hypothetical protein [Leptothrix sp. C29]NRT56023.1 hypothetical protein [Leptothrix sp. C29]